MGNGIVAVCREKDCNTFKSNITSSVVGLLDTSSSSINTISGATIDSCRACWVNILRNRSGTENSSIFLAEIDSVFSKMLQKVDVDGIVSPMLVPALKKPLMPVVNSSPKSSRRFAKYRTFGNVFVMIVNHILYINDDSFKTKAKLRALGRAHARIGILLYHYVILNEAIVQSMMELAGKLYCTFCGVAKCWTELLNFVTQEMSYEKVFFVDHRDTFEDSYKLSFNKLGSNAAHISMGCGDATEKTAADEKSNANEAFC